MSSFRFLRFYGFPGSQDGIDQSGCHRLSAQIVGTMESTHSYYEMLKNAMLRLKTTWAIPPIYGPGLFNLYQIYLLRFTHRYSSTSSNRRGLPAVRLQLAVVPKTWIALNLLLLWSRRYGYACSNMHTYPHLPDSNSKRLRKILNLGTTASLPASCPFI